MKNYRQMDEIRFATEIQTDQSIKLDIIENMGKHGGSFVRALGNCLLHADPLNTYKIAFTFRDYLLRYLPSEWD